MKYLILSFLLMGCNSVIGTQFKCVDGVLYSKHDGAWVQALMYEKNKCLSLSEEETK